MLKKPGSKKLEEVLNCRNPTFIDFLKRCFAWEPERRLTPREALSHEWILQNRRRNKLKLESIKLSVGKLPIHLKKHYSTERRAEEVKEVLGKGLNKTNQLKLNKIENGLMKFKERVKVVAASQLLQGREKCHTVKTTIGHHGSDNLLYSIFSKTKILRAETNK